MLWSCTLPGDSQKQQFNSMNWPYIGPCVKDQDMKVRVVTKSICVEESTRMCAWVAQMMHDMEPCFSLSQSLLETLGIEQTL
jgi:hypothetical protein